MPCGFAGASEVIIYCNMLSEMNKNIERSKTFGILLIDFLDVGFQIACSPNIVYMHLCKYKKPDHEAATSDGWWGEPRCIALVND